MNRRHLAARAFAISMSCATLAAGAKPAKPPASKSAAPKPLARSLTGSAKSDYEAGRLLATDGDYAGALIKFQSAYDVAKDPRLLWNLAFCEKNLRHYARVVRLLQRYIAEGGALVSDPERKQAQELIATIEPFTTRVTFHVNEEGAQIFVDDELMGTSPLATPPVLDIGVRTIRVTKDGFLPYTTSLPVGGSADATVDVKLEKEVHEGHLLVQAPAGTTIFLDDQQAGVGNLDKNVPSGGHQLRVTAPGMRPYQSEIVIQDKETRSVDVVLEAEAPPEKPHIRVAVGCTDSAPRGPDDGMVAYLDGPDVVAPASVKKRWDGEQNVVEHVEYPASAGHHTLRLRIPGCESLESPVDVDATKGADLTGALESDALILVRGPQGSPGHWRVALSGLFMGRGISSGLPETYDNHGLGLKGAALTGGLITRWFGLYTDLGYATGSLSRATFNTTYALPATANARDTRAGIRFGPRIPFNIVALAAGVGAALEQFNVEGVRTGNLGGFASFWGGLDIEPLCDWGLSVMGAAEKPFNNDPVGGTLQIGLFFEPSDTCHKERATAFGLRTAKP